MSSLANRKTGSGGARPVTNWNAGVANRLRPPQTAAAQRQGRVVSAYHNKRGKR